MIIYFKVGNYKSIKDPITLNFNASSISELADSNIIETGKHSLLKSMILYGHNASGKSKILEAFKYFKGFIIKSASIGLHSNSILPFYPFLLNDTSRNEPSFFELSFVLNKIKYRYGFEADNNMIHKEWLLESKAEKEYPVFLRINQNFEIDFKRFKNANELDKRTKSNVLFLSVASQWNVEKSLEITNWLAKILGIDELEDDFDYKELTIELLKKDKYQQLIGKFLNVADLGIKKIDVHEFNFEEIEVSLEQFAPSNLTPEDKKYLLDVVKRKGPNNIVTKHEKYNNNREFIGYEDFFLNTHESDGTKRFFSLIGLIILAIKQNRVLIIDEFDSRLHTLLSKAILKLFNSAKIKSTAQILVASHDTALLDNNIFRRDQIYFIEKDKYGATQATSLVEYKNHRKDSPIDKNYLDGKFGAIPFIDDLEKLFENGES